MEPRDELKRDEAQWQLLAAQKTGTGSTSSSASSSDTERLGTAIQRGDFCSVLTSTAARPALAPFAKALNGADSTPNFRAINITVGDDAEELLFVGVAALHAFIQANWTGPDLESDLDAISLVRRACPDAFPLRTFNKEKAGAVSEKCAPTDEELWAVARSASLDALTVAGEPAYHLCEAPFLLVLALRVLQGINDSKRSICSLPWWQLRAASIHARVLDTPFSPDERIVQEVSRLATRLVEAEDPFFRRLGARLRTDHALALQRSGKEREANDLLLEAARASGLRYKLTGALGKRTKFQKDEKTILVLKAESAEMQSIERQTESEENSGKTYLEMEENKTGWKAAAAPNGHHDMPSEFLHNDDTLLEKTRFTENASLDDELAHCNINDPSPLDPQDSAILLGLCLNISNAAPENGLTASEMLAFVSRVLAHACNWSVHTMALLLRSRLEAHRTRTAQRAALQLQALIDQMPSDDSSIEDRLRYVHELELPSKWEMQAELARRYAGLGVIRSALEIFERIELWQEAVQCWGALGRQDKGIELVGDLLHGRKTEAEHVSFSKRSTGDEPNRQRLNSAREAKLWCLLGDLEVEQATAHYTKAWEISSGSSARAARSLGGVAFAAGDIDDAILWLRRGLRIQPLLARSWFILGCAYMRRDSPQGWLEAARSFRRCTALDDEDAESWNNLASCYLRLGQQSQRVISEAARAEETNAEMDQRAVLANDDDEDNDDDTASHRTSDSGIGLASSGDETDTDEHDTEAAALRHVNAAVAATAAIAGGQSNSSAFDVKLLAHKALLKALRFSRDDWRVWNNFMIVSVDCGLLSDAVRAMARVAEIKQSEDAVDLAVLNRIVDALINAESAENLWPLVRRLFEDAILPRFSSSAPVWRAYARLLLWRGRLRSALEAHLSAWRASYGAEASENAIQTDRTEWLQAVEALQELCELLENFGDREIAVDDEGNECDNEDSADAKREPAMSNWRFRARSLVRAFMGRTKDAWEIEADWQRLEDLRKSLAPVV